MYGGYSIRWPPEAYPSIIPFFWMQAEFVASSQLIKTNRKVAKMIGYHSHDSVQFSYSIGSYSFRPHGLQHARLPYPSPIPGACSNSCPWSRWCHPTISSSVIPIRVFSKESVLCIRWPKYWSFSFSISPSNEYSGLIFFTIDWLDLLAVHGALKSLLQHHSSEASIFWQGPSLNQDNITLTT